MIYDITRPMGSLRLEHLTIDEHGRGHVTVRLGGEYADVVIDIDLLARQLGGKAMRAKAGQSVLGGGSLRAKRIKAPGT